MGSINRDEFLEIGTHCSDKSCNQLDFLPFKCPSCALPFCSDHWRPDRHPCSVYDPIKANNLIPSCPLCSLPVSYPPSTDPNLAMDHHLSTTCPILFPSAKPLKSATPICAAKKCSTKMVVPILCPDCRARFCFAHRFAADHNCAGKKKVLPVASSSGGSKGKGVLGGMGLKKVISNGKSSSNVGASTSKSTNLPIVKPKPKPLITKANSKSSTSQSINASVAAAAAEARALGLTSNSKSKSTLGTKSNPIIISDDEVEEDEVKVISAPKRALIALTPATRGDKRAVQERASARRALEMRASRGLLSKSEELMYAEMQALEAAASKAGKSSCSMS